MKPLAACKTLIILGLFGAAPAFAQENWSGLQTPIASSSEPPFTYRPAPPLNGNEYVVARCNDHNDPPQFQCPAGDGRAYEIPLYEFARSSTVQALGNNVQALGGALQALDDRVDALSAQADAQARTIRHDLHRGIALASAFDLRSPSAGQSNRFGISTAAYEGRVAFSLNYTRQEGRFDFSLGVATSGSAQAGKAGAGISW